MEDEEKRAEEEARSIFEAKAVKLSKREVEIPEGNHKSFDEAENDLGSPTDLQATLKRLFPKFPIHIIDRVASAVMVGRILHETMLERINLTVNAIVEDWEEEDDGDIDVMMIINMVTTGFEIGLDSKGRVDAIELHGAANESEELEKLASSYGGS